MQTARCFLTGSTSPGRTSRSSDVARTPHLKRPALRCQHRMNVSCSEVRSLPSFCPVPQVHRNRHKAVPELWHRLQDPRAHPAGAHPPGRGGFGCRPVLGVGQRGGRGRERQQREVRAAGCCRSFPNWRFHKLAFIRVSPSETPVGMVDRCGCARKNDHLINFRGVLSVETRCI